MCKVSIIVPVFNGENFVEKCITKLLEQTFYEIEVIIINDGSTDKTQKICEEMCKKDARIKLFNQENAGPSAARNLGLEMAVGEWITFVDSDDWLDKDCIQFAYDIAIEENADIVLWNLQNERNGKIKMEMPFYDESKFYRAKDMYKFIDILLTDKTETCADSLSVKGPYCKLIKSEIAKKCKFPVNINLGEDVCFSHQLYDCAKNLVYVNNIFYHRIMNSDSLSEKKDIERGKRRIEYANWVLNYRQDYNVDMVNLFAYMKYKEIAIYYFGKGLKLPFKEKKHRIQVFLENLNWEINFKRIPNDKYLFLLRKQWYFVFYVYCNLINFLRPAYQIFRGRSKNVT